jgi:molybdate transport system regulatory protein
MTQGMNGAASAFGGRGLGPIGRERIVMLEAVATHGSITQAAKTLGASDKAVRDGLNAINNLLPRPAVRAGGNRPEVTEDGRRLITSFRRLETVLSRICQAIGEEDGECPDQLFWSGALKTSARNAFRCLVVEVRRSAVNVEVTLRLSDSNTMAAVITPDSADELAIERGREVIALVESSFPLLVRADKEPRMLTCNRIVGTVMARTDERDGGEVVLDIGDGKTLTALVAGDGTEAPQLAVGDPAYAFFMASQVILACD